MATSSENMTSTSVDNANTDAIKDLAGSDSQQQSTSTGGTDSVDTTAVDTSTNGTEGVDTAAVDTSTSGTGGVETTAVLTATSGTNGDDNIAVLPDAHYVGGSGGDNFIFHDAGHYKIDDFNASQGDKLDFSKYGLSREELASRVTNIKIEADNLIVNFGDNVEITLAGVHPGQISWDDVVVDHGGKGPGGKDDDHGGKGPGGKDDDHGGKGSGGKDDDHGGKGHGGHKHVDARPNEHCQGDEGADNFVFHDLGHWKIDKYNGQEGDMLDFTGYGLNRDEIASHITNIKIEADTFIVNFGDDVSITLVGQPPTWDNVITPEG
jgi:hypothetical protein